MNEGPISLSATNEVENPTSPSNKQSADATISPPSSQNEELQTDNRKREDKPFDIEVSGGVSLSENTDSTVSKNQDLDRKNVETNPERLTTTSCHLDNLLYKWDIKVPDSQQVSYLLLSSNKSVLESLHIWY